MNNHTIFHVIVRLIFENLLLFANEVIKCTKACYCTLAHCYDDLFVWYSRRKHVIIDFTNRFRAME